MTRFVFIFLTALPLFSNDLNFIIQPFGWEEVNGFVDVDIFQYDNAITSACTITEHEISFSKDKLVHDEMNLYTLSGDFVVDFTYAVEHLPLTDLGDSYSFISDEISCLFIIINENLNRLYYNFEVIPYDLDPFPQNRSIPNKTLHFYPNENDLVFSIADANTWLEENHGIIDELETITGIINLNLYSRHLIEDREKENYLLGEYIGTANRLGLQVHMTPFFNNTNILPILIYPEEIKDDISDLIIKFSGNNPYENKYSPPKKETTSVGIANESRIRIRTEPNLESETIGHLDEGDIVFILDSTKGNMIIGDMESVWFKIETEDDLVGWSYGFFIDVIIK